MKYYIWTEGCQMNVADSRRLASALEKLDYEPAGRMLEADLVVLNTCMVRQSAEDKAYNRLQALRSLKKKRPEMVINLMGCMVGVKENNSLREQFAFVDVFSAPSDIRPLLAYLAQAEGRRLSVLETENRFAWMDGDVVLPFTERGNLVATYLPVMDGCSHACTYCIIPYRRGIERSRPAKDILEEARALAAQGVKEITLLGQIVDRYGKDQPGFPTLAGLLRQLHDVEGLERIRFLTSHPNWMTGELLETTAELPRVMPHIEVPVQAGSDEVLENMRRGYTVEQYRRLIERIRSVVVGASISTDVIVGFPGESEAQFQESFDLLAELKLDVAHLARYSPRPGTVSQRQMLDDVPDEEKWRRFRLLEDLQKEITAEINARLLSTTVNVLFEEKVKTRWRGRTETNKLVFVESEENLRSRLLPVNIHWSGPWSMIGNLCEKS